MTLNLNTSPEMWKLMLHHPIKQSILLNSFIKESLDYLLDVRVVAVDTRDSPTTVY